MPDQQLFEYAVIRLVPRVEREEFLNLGVIVFCKKQNYLGVKFIIDKNRINAFSPSVEIDCVEDSLNSLLKISKADKDGGPISRLDTAGRFRWLTATKSTIIQTSKIHPGLSDDPAATLELLFEKLVL
ncbi:MAG: DUF3037 domain-containing protein [Chitinophagaceae bacterium]|nr:MAG: DUF3037 domain-containing protein [Chitinophagaceae bacterium]